MVVATAAPIDELASLPPPPTTTVAAMVDAATTVRPPPSPSALPVLEASPEQESDDEHLDDGAVPIAVLKNKTKSAAGAKTVSAAPVPRSALRGTRGPDGKPFRRATTIDVPGISSLQPPPRRHSTDSSSTDNDSGSLADLGGAATAPPRTLVRSMSMPARAAAVDAIENRKLRFRFSTAASAREAVREMYSFRVREFPSECLCECEARALLHGVWRRVRVELDRDGLACARTSVFRKKTKALRLSSDDLLGAALGGDAQTLVVHFMAPGRGAHEQKLRRQYRTLELRFADAEAAERWRAAVQTLVKWLARVPPASERRIKVVVNPHSGRRRGRQIFAQWRPLLELAGIQCDVEETQYSGHARDIAAALDLSRKYEALVFVGGDGTVNEFMSGIFRREEREWRHLVATTPLSLLSAGTDNAFGLGVGTPTHESAVYCIIKRKIRPLDVLAIEGPRPGGGTAREYACCGVSYGIGGDIAMESEKMRWMGVHRYAYLKLKRGVLAPRPHNARLKYVLSDSVPTAEDGSGRQQLRTYFDIADETAGDQHHIELCSVYDESMRDKVWSGDASSIFEPASERKFGGLWREEAHAYGTVGASNVYFETKYAHPSDGNMDLIVVRKGSAGKMLDIMWRYIAGDYLESSLVDYFKIKALVIEQEVPDPINVDGELFDGPGPFRIEVVPQLLCVLSEK